MSSTRLSGSDPFLRSTRYLTAARMSSSRRVRSSRSGTSSAEPLSPLGHPLFRIETQLVIQLQAPDAGEVVPLRVEEQVAEQVRRGVESGRVPRAHAAVDVDDRLFPRRRLVREERVVERRPGVERIEVEERKLVDPASLEVLQVGLCDLLVAFDSGQPGLPG